MATLQETVRALNTVRTNGQARSAVGAASKVVSAAYPRLGDIPWASDYRESSKKELDRARAALEAVYPRIPANGLSATIDPRLWKEARDAIVGGYIASEGVTGAAEYEPVTSNLSILGTSIAEAPRVFAKGVGSVAAAVGDTAGTVVGGVFSGLGFFWTLILILAGAALVFGRLKGIV